MTTRKLLAALLTLGALALRVDVHAQMDPSHNTTTPDVPGLTAATSVCKASTDATYGTTKENPIKVGGGDLYMASRQVKFLSALRGPTGEGVHFRRNGSVDGPDKTILDIYSLQIKDAKPVTLYLDGYRWSDPLSPVGFLCGASMNLAPPGPDAFETTRQRLSIGIELGSADVEPISMDPDGSKKHGVVYDHTRLIGLAARAAAADGKPFTIAELPRPLMQARMVAIAYPLACGDEMIPPELITLTDARGNQAPASATASGDKIASLAPGLPAPAHAMAVAYSVGGLIDGSRTTIHYSKPCQGQQDVVMPVVSTKPGVVTQAPAPVPAGKTVPEGGAKVVLQLFVAEDGSARFPAFVSGDFEFTDAAIESLKGWRFEPSRMNGGRLYQPEKVMVVVK